MSEHLAETHSLEMAGARGVDRVPKKIGGSVKKQRQVCCHNCLKIVGRDDARGVNDEYRCESCDLEITRTQGESMHADAKSFWRRLNMKKQPPPGRGEEERWYSTHKLILDANPRIWWTGSYFEIKGIISNFDEVSEHIERCHQNGEITSEKKYHALKSVEELKGLNRRPGYGEVVKVEVKHIEELERRWGHIKCLNEHKELEFQDEFRSSGRILVFSDGEEDCCHNMEAIAVIYYNIFDETTGTLHGEPARG